MRIGAFLNALQEITSLQRGAERLAKQYREDGDELNATVAAEYEARAAAYAKAHKIMLDMMDAEDKRKANMEARSAAGFRNRRNAK